MVFADVQNSHSEIRQTVQNEATALIGILANLERIDSNESYEIQLLLRDYAERVADVEWKALSEAQLTMTAGRMLTDIKIRALSLPGNTTEYAALRTSTLSGLEELSGFHRKRMVASAVDVPYLFWWVVVFGFFVIVALFFPFHRTLLNMGLLSAFCAMTGIVLFFIYVMSHPFSGPAKIPPTQFEFIIANFDFEPAK
jgi:hypothetical protein